jgi:hypothetical protein
MHQHEKDKEKILKTVRETTRRCPNSSDNRLLSRSLVDKESDEIFTVMKEKMPTKNTISNKTAF